MNKKIFIFAGMLLMSLVFLIGSVSALAISSPYYKDNPLKISPGERLDFQLVLKNSAGVTPVSVSAEVVSGADIAKITDSSKTYNVDAGGEATLNLRVDVPSDSLGKSYPLTVSFKTIGSSSGGTVGIETAIDISIPVMVVEKEKSASGWNNSTTYLIVAILVVLALVLFLKRKKRR